MIKWLLDEEPQEHYLLERQIRLSLDWAVTPSTRCTVKLKTRMISPGHVVARLEERQSR